MTLSMKSRLLETCSEYPPPAPETGLHESATSRSWSRFTSKSLPGPSISGVAGTSANREMLRRSGMTAKDARLAVPARCTRESFAGGEADPLPAAMGYVDVELAKHLQVAPSLHGGQWSVPQTEDWLEQPLGDGVVRTRFKDRVHELELSGRRDLDALCVAPRVALEKGWIDSDYLQFVDQDTKVRFDAPVALLARKPAAAPRRSLKTRAKILKTGAKMTALAAVPTPQHDGVALGSYKDGDKWIVRVALTSRKTATAPVWNTAEPMMMAPQQAVYAQVLVDKATVGQALFAYPDQDGTVLRCNTENVGRFVGFAAAGAHHKNTHISACVAGALAIAHTLGPNAKVNDCFVAGSRTIRVLASEEGSGPYVLLE